jgi:hypothetical protein
MDSADGVADRCVASLAGLYRDIFEGEQDQLWNPEAAYADGALSCQWPEAIMKRIQEALGPAARFVTANDDLTDAILSRETYLFAGFPPTPEGKPHPAEVITLSERQVNKMHLAEKQMPERFKLNCAGYWRTYSLQAVVRWCRCHGEDTFETVRRADTPEGWWECFEGIGWQADLDVAIAPGGPEATSQPIRYLYQLQV